MMLCRVVACVRVEGVRESRSSFLDFWRLFAGGRAATLWRRVASFWRCCGLCRCCGPCRVSLVLLWAVPLLWALPRLLGAAPRPKANKWPVGPVVRFLAAPRPRRGPIGKDLTFRNCPWFRAMGERCGPIGKDLTFQKRRSAMFSSGVVRSGRI